MGMSISISRAILTEDQYNRWLKNDGFIILTYSDATPDGFTQSYLTYTEAMEYVREAESKEPDLKDAFCQDCDIEIPENHDWPEEVMEDYIKYCLDDYCLYWHDVYNHRQMEEYLDECSWDCYTDIDTIKIGDGKLCFVLAICS